MTKEQFIGEIENWNNYKPLLWEALEATFGSVIEMGIGMGSTKILHDYCNANNRPLFSYENNEQWFDQYKHLNNEYHHMMCLTDNWDVVDNTHLLCGVLFVDHAPGERRHIDVELFKDKANIIVIHDTEPEADHGYQMSKIWHLFKYVKHYQSAGAWASAVSNNIDVTKFLGESQNLNSTTMNT